MRDWEALGFIVPENRLRYYDMREVIAGIADLGSVLEIRKASKPHSDSSAGFRSNSRKKEASMSCIHVASTPA